MDGPWFIYDHYLTVKEWSPNFHPASDTIKEVAMWLRISGLPIEYYDSRALKFIGNRIGKTVKVDKNTLSQERGKYARLCVQVNLSQPLLAMFTIKGRKYNIEYEGLHMLCTICGRHGHYKEGCPDKAKVSEEHGNEKVGEATGKEANRNLAGSSVEGPWRVVQKTRRNKKANPGKIGERETNNAPPAAAIIAQPEKINFHANSTGSRFNSLLEDTAELEKESMDRVENVRVVEVEGEDNQGTNQREHAVEFSKIKNKRVNGGRVINRGDGMADRIPKESKLATRGGSFKGKSSTHGKRGVDNIMDRVGVQLLENTLGQSKQANFNHATHNEEDTTSTRIVMGSEQQVRFGPILQPNPGVPRPPNWSNLPPTTLSNFSTPAEEEQVGEGEVFVDANDQGSVGSQESDMEVVVETISLS
jgi:hypothetical protein